MNAMNVNTMRMIVLGLLVATGCRAKSADTTTPEDAASTPPAGAGAQPDAAAAENAGYDDESPEDDEPY